MRNENTVLLYTSRTLLAQAKTNHLSVFLNIRPLTRNRGTPPKKENYEEGTKPRTQKVLFGFKVLMLTHIHRNP